MRAYYRSGLANFTNVELKDWGAHLFILAITAVSRH